MLFRLKKNFYIQWFAQKKRQGAKNLNFKNNVFKNQGELLNKVLRI